MPRLLSFIALLIASHPALGVDRVTFATNWKAQAEHGGFYQAVAEGIYAERGLDVRILQGGPLVNNRAQLVVGRVDFLMASNLIQTFDGVRQGLPTVTIAGFFQRDAHCLIAHPGQGNDRWEDLAKAPILVGNAGRQTYFRWLTSAHGFSESQARTYTFNSAPFLVNKRAVQQGYATAEPLAIAKALGHEPRVYLLADYGWSTYSTMLETRRDLVESSPDLVQRFVDASILGWVRYLYGDPEAADRLIKRDNPSMSDEQLAYSRRQMLERGIVDSGETLTAGIGALSEERIADFLQKMVAAGLYEPGQIDASQGYDCRFVNQGVGVAEKRVLLEASAAVR
ncbi:ABC transporter substrate-binding protein [Botrimarina hoheduenensis]|uniref:NMT1/THI5 like protein n=1 Tax=Botrimarina hoheduenensis TaxID=2528000 RepID=A0A5C5VRQ0_9BACT|nr:ABC transporter substrate-binding protein [Botrimarina hoheduenensis]TWT40847.1 NMT1/THI5 like protein [Botrimarina hoheduenensis]